MLRVGQTVHCPKRGWLVVGRRTNDSYELYRVKGARRRIVLPLDYEFSVGASNQPCPIINGRLEHFTDGNGMTHAVKNKMHGGDPIFFRDNDASGNPYMKPATYVKTLGNTSAIYIEFGENVTNIKHVPANKVVRFA